MNNNPTKTPFVFHNPFKHFCQSIGAIPTSYQDSLDYYETLLWLIKFLENTVIPAVNTNSEAVTELQGFYLQLQSYVNNYFDNLDVQEEINNKLDEMVEDGTLEQILLNYMNVTRVYNTYTEMIADKNNFVNDMKIRTLGYYSEGDLGDSYYLITNAVNSNVYQIDLENGLFANLITNESINIKEFGAVEDGETDDLIPFQNAISCLTKNNVKNLILNPKEYFISDMVTFASKNIYGNDATIKFNQQENSDSYPIHFTGNDFVIENLNVSLNPNSFYGWAFRMQNCRNVKINNGNFTHTIDIYSDNSNIQINNIVSNTGITVRELSNKTTENITFTNCIVDRPAMEDEVVWIVSSYGTIRNIKVVNCNIRHRGNAENYLAISAYRENCLCENIVFENCKFDFTVTGYRAMHFNYSSVQIKGITKNVFFNNCQFTITGNSSTNNIYLCQNESDTYLIKFNNCYFDIPNAFKYGFTNSIFNDSNIEIKTTNYCFNKCKINNSNINAPSCEILTVGATEIDKSKITNDGVINVINMNLYGSANSSFIRNCEINVTSNTLFQINSNNGNITVENSKINNVSNGTVFALNSPSNISNILLKNVDLSSEYNNLSNYTTYMNLNVINLTHNNNQIPVLINDIDANTRRSLALNTIILAPIDTGLYYRKISDGNLTSNWKLYCPEV